MAAAEWVGETWRTYVGNATSVRDFRVQMRGSKTVLAWSLYLIVLLLTGYYAYDAIAMQGSFGSAASIQYRLVGFYGTVMRVVAGAIVLIAPGLTAASIVGERQRRSFDLVFSAPVSPKYYLVGKMLGSYRYVLMLLVLSMPVVALTALLGGATWSDILVSYLLTSCAGLILTSIALAVSSVQERVQSAIATTYLLAVVYMIFTAYGAVFVAFGRGGGASVSEAPFTATLNPFLVPETYGTYTMLGGTQVPNWILTLLFTLAVCKFLVLGAGSALSSYGSAETKSFRMQGLIYLVGLVVLFGLVPLPMGGTRMFAFVTFGIGLLVLVIPWIAAFGDIGRRIWQFDGTWNIRRMFVGTPSGALPYLMAMFVAVGLAAFAVCMRQGFLIEEGVPYMFHGMGVLAFFAGVTRWVCSRMGLAKGRSLAQVITFGGILVVPLIVTTSVSLDSTSKGIPVNANGKWLFWPLWPLCADLGTRALYTYGISGLVAGVLLWWTADIRANSDGVRGEVANA